MAIYAIGDIQGCYDELQQLLAQIQFDPAQDQLWFVGDLVNRGPKSLETLRYIKSLGDAAVVVLGNHDLHLLAIACKRSSVRDKDTLTAVLKAPDREALLTWLRHRPLLHRHEQFCLVHAGLPPHWDIDTAQKMAQKVEKVLRGDKYEKFFRDMYGNEPSLWRDKLSKPAQLRYAVNCFTRMRCCEANGRLDFKYSGTLADMPPKLTPWFAMPKRQSADVKVIFGHWSALGYHQHDNCYAIDTGCLWGGQLTALRLDESMQRISLDCAGYRVPKRELAKAETLASVPLPQANT